MDPNKQKNNNNNKKNGKGGKNLRGALILVLWAVALTVAINYLSAYAGNTANKSTSHEVPYSELWQLVEQDKIDSVTFEQGRPTPMDREGMSKYLAAEMCYTLNDHWGIGSNDFNYKSPAILIETLCSCRRVGANLLLNIGPTAQGGVDPFQRELMNIVGKWMNIYGESIYEGKPHPAVCGNEKNFVLRSDEYLYFFIHGLGRRGSKHVNVETECNNDFVFHGVTEKIESVQWMDDGEVLDFTHENDEFSLFATGFPYGTSTCVRVAKAKIKK